MDNPFRKREQIKQVAGQRPEDALLNAANSALQSNRTVDAVVFLAENQKPVPVEVRIVISQAKEIVAEAERLDGDPEALEENRNTLFLDQPLTTEGTAEAARNNRLHVVNFYLSLRSLRT